MRRSSRRVLVARCGWPELGTGWSLSMEPCRGHFRLLVLARLCHLCARRIVRGDGIGSGIVQSLQEIGKKTGFVPVFSFMIYLRPYEGYLDL